MKNINRFFASAAAVLALVSCEKKGAEPFFVQTETFSGNRLELFYSDCLMHGKSVTVTPDAEDASKATLTLAGMDWSAVAKAEGPVKTSGVLPGQFTTELDVTMSVFADHAEISGESQVEGYSVTTKGSFDRNGLKIHFDVIAPQNPLAGNYGLNAENPLIINWDADRFPFGDGDWAIQDALRMVMMMVKIEGKSPAQHLAELLHEVYFLNDGNVQIKYSPADQRDKQVVSPLNLAFYSGVTENSAKLSLNVFGIQKMIQSQQPGNDPATKAPAENGGDKPTIQVDLAAVINDVKAVLNNAITNGVKLGYRMDAEKKAMELFLDKDTLLPLLEAVCPIFEDPGAVAMIVEVLKQSAPAEMQQMVTVFVPPILNGLPITIKTTRSIEIGIRLVPQVTETVR